MQSPGNASSRSSARSVEEGIPQARKRSKAGHRRRHRAVQKKTATPLSPAETSAQPATVSLKNGKLTIQANNSDLSQILQNVAHLSGMTIEGLSRSARIFGVYGPGRPSDVLTGLLVGSGYNFVIVGERADGAPRELLLTTRNGSASALKAANPSSAPSPASNEAANPSPAPSPPVLNDANAPEQPDFEPGVADSDPSRPNQADTGATSDSPDAGSTSQQPGSEINGGNPDAAPPDQTDSTPDGTSTSEQPGAEVSGGNPDAASPDQMGSTTAPQADE